MANKSEYNELTDESTQTQYNCTEKLKTVLQNFLVVLKENVSLLILVAGITVGIVLGFVILYINSDFYLDKRKIMYLGFLGEIFLRMLSCIIIPLLTATLISAMSSIPPGLSSSMMGAAFAYYLTTTFTGRLPWYCPCSQR